jgi:transposase
MTQHNLAAATVTVGLDVGDRYSHLCLVDSAGDVVEEGRLPTTPVALERRFGHAERMRIVLETGTHSPWISRLLSACGHEVIVANARRLRLISESDSKNDRSDAEALARIGRLDPALLAPIHHRGPAAQSHLAVLRARAVLVRVRTQLVNHVRGAVKSVGGRLPMCSAESLPKRVRDALPADLSVALAPLLTMIETVTREVRTYDHRVTALVAEGYPEAAHLQQVPGVGPLTALCYVLTLEDPTRFHHSRSVGAYVGLRSKQHDSSDSAPELRITKAGDPMLRHLLVCAAQYTLGPFGPESDLRRWGLSLAARGRKNAKKRAVVAVARKLAVLLHRLWITGAAYEPFRVATVLATHRSA